MKCVYLAHFSIIFKSVIRWYHTAAWAKFCILFQVELAKSTNIIYFVYVLNFSLWSTSWIKNYQVGLCAHPFATFPRLCVASIHPWILICNCIAGYWLRFSIFLFVGIKMMSDNFLRDQMFFFCRNGCGSHPLIWETCKTKLKDPNILLLKSRARFLVLFFVSFCFWLIHSYLANVIHFEQECGGWRCLTLDGNYKW